MFLWEDERQRWALDHAANSQCPYSTVFYFSFFKKKNIHRSTNIMQSIVWTIDEFWHFIFFYWWPFVFPVLFLSSPSSHSLSLSPLPPQKKKEQSRSNAMIFVATNTSRFRCRIFFFATRSSISHFLDWKERPINISGWSILRTHTQKKTHHNNNNNNNLEQWPGTSL